MWEALRPKMAGLDPQRIESHLTASGIPDVNYVGGWIELKYMPRWPVRGGPLRIDHFTREQRAWLTRRVRAGGRAFLLLKVGRVEWLLFRGDVAAQVVGKLPRDELYRHSCARWLRAPRNEELKECLLK